jgi:hypothetical protein
MKKSMVFEKQNQSENQKKSKKIRKMANKSGQDTWLSYAWTRQKWTKMATNFFHV